MLSVEAAQAWGMSVPSRAPVQYLITALQMSLGGSQAAKGFQRHFWLLLQSGLQTGFFSDQLDNFSRSLETKHWALHHLILSAKNVLSSDDPAGTWLSEFMPALASTQLALASRDWRGSMCVGTPIPLIRLARALESSCRAGMPAIHDMGARDHWSILQHDLGHITSLIGIRNA